MKLYICEKSSMAKALVSALPGAKQRGDGHVKCGDDIVAWASGHLLELCEPEDYDERYRHWGRDTILYVPERWRLKVKERTKGLFSGLKKLIGALDMKLGIIVNAGDADREGQTLIDEILDYCGWKGRTLRLRINDMNPDAIRKALDSMRDNAEYRGEYMAGIARIRADNIVGLAMTRYVTVSLREAGYDAGVISVGRVQTPTLGLVVARDSEIENFVPSPYYELRGTLALDGGRKISGRWLPGEKHAAVMDGQKRLIDRETAYTLVKSLDGQSGEITAVNKKTHKVSPPLPFSLSKLQMAASRKYDITDTLVHVQKLYEAGCVTYPRTSCEYIPEGHFEEAAKMTGAIRASCPSLSDMLDGVDLSRKSAAWDTSRITEHHAIIPTTRVPLEGVLSEKERKIYELICARYALQFLQDYVYEETSVDFSVGGETFGAAGRTVVNLGWQGWDKSDEDGKSDTRGNGKENGEAEEEARAEGEILEAREDNGIQVLPGVREGERGSVQASIAEKVTKPPKPYTYHGLICDMNNIHTHVKDPAIRAKLKEIQGIGTEATQESIILTLFERGYVKKEKKSVISTDLGKLLIDLMGTNEKTSMIEFPDMTALWERRMDEIQGGSASLDDFVEEVAGMVRNIVSGNLDVPASIPGMTRRKKCPVDGCSGYLRYIKDAKTPFFACPVCHATFSDVGGEPVPKKEKLPALAEAPCPMNCGGKAQKYEGKYGYFWKCACSPSVIFGDADGVPVVREARAEAACPVKGCKGKAVRFERKSDGQPFWKCGVCGNFFEDVDGAPVQREKKEKRRNRGK
jgi:DNA topoisomerase-3